MNASRVFGISFRHAASRRAAVAVLYLSFVTGGSLFAISRAMQSVWLLGAAVLCFAVCLADYLAVHFLTRSYAVHQSRARCAWRADEREALVRDRAMARSYQIASFLLLTGVGWMGMVERNPTLWRPSTYGEWSYLFWFVLLLTSTLPQAMILWREPAPPLDNLTEAAA